MTELRPDGPLVGRIVRAEPIEERHREGLREAAERDPQIHRYTNLYTFGFDRWFELALESANEVPFVVHVDGRPVGSSRYLNVEPFHRRLEIGWTWLERAQLGIGFEGAADLGGDLEARHAGRGRIGGGEERKVYVGRHAEQALQIEAAKVEILFARGHLF